MVTNFKRKRERGTAMMMAMFALMLLSAVGLGMMYAAGTETSINANYREKQMAMYAATAGLQEARDRLQPSTGDIGSAITAGTLLTGLPGSDGTNIVYILNPRAGETINPWLPSATNAYFDTELCQERIPGLSGTLGVPCTEAPPPGALSTAYDNGAVTYSGPYSFNPPLLHKWVRITLKASNATSIPTNGDSATRVQVCWDGKNQIPLPTGYSTNCAPAGAGKVISIALDPMNLGSGYNTPGTFPVTISGGGGTGAAATANVVAHSTTTTVSSGQVASVDVCATCQGSGYTYAVPPIVTINGDGTGAFATAAFIPAGKQVENVNLTSAGSPAGCYGSAPAVALVPSPSGSGATAHATLSGGGTTTTCIRSISFTGNCNTHKGDTNVAFSATGGLAGVVNFDANGRAIPTSVRITNPGSGYTADPVVAVSGCSGGNALSAAMVRGYNVASLVRDQKGFGYDNPPLVNVAAPDSGATPTGSAILGSSITGGNVTGVTVTAGGSGYTSATVTFSAPPAGGSAASGVATIATVPSTTTTTTYTLECCTVTAPGSGYSGAPNVTINGGGGTGAQGIATVGSSHGKPFYGQVFQITSLAVTASGARAMTQVELATPVRGVVPGGALTLAGPAPASPNKLYDETHSAGFQINGNDANSCGETAMPTRPAIGVYDDPNHPTSPSAVQNVVDGISKVDNYPGAQPSPDVENVYGSLGDTMGTPAGLDDFAKSIVASPGCTFGNNPAASMVESMGCYGTPTSPMTTVINGDFTTAGNPSGYGILLVTGTLYLSGNFSWHGVVLVIGQAGVTQLAGGGNAEIVGTMFVAKTRDSSGNLLPTLGSPKVDWSGGGGNGILYDHCWSDNLLANVPFTPPVTTRPLKVLSTRTVTY